MCTPKSMHIRPLLLRLHWLPVCFYIQFKLLLLIFKALHGFSHLYQPALSDLAEKACCGYLWLTIYIWWVSPTRHVFSAGILFHPKLDCPDPSWYFIRPWRPDYLTRLKAPIELKTYLDGFIVVGVIFKSFDYELSNFWVYLLLWFFIFFFLFFMYCYVLPRVALIEMGSCRNLTNK